MRRTVQWSELGSRVRGDLSTRHEDLERAGRDFGNGVPRPPSAVLRPSGADDVATAMRFGRSMGIPVVARGSGHSVDGQVTAPGGLVVDLGSLRSVHRTGSRRLAVGAGARWGAVVSATLARGQVPPVVPDHLGLSVGGTVSVGGVGGTSHHHGFVSDNLVDLEVVTDEGEVLTCSPSLRSPLFDLVRGTQGRHGIITRVTVALGDAAHRVRPHKETLPDLSALLDRQRALVLDPRSSHVEGAIRHDPVRGWAFTLDTAEFLGPEETFALEGETRGGLSAHADLLDRNASAVARARARGTWYRDPHPRRSVLLPGDSAERIIARVLDTHLRSGLGEGGGALVLVLPSDRLRTPALPRMDDEFTVLFGIQGTGTFGDTEGVRRLRRANELLCDLARAVGGGPYAAGTTVKR